MASVRVLQQSFIDNRLVEEGTILPDYDGPIGSNLEEVDKDGNPVKAKRGGRKPTAKVEEAEPADDEAAGETPVDDSDLA